MKKWSNKSVQNLILTIEAALIIMSLATTGKALVGMICYWSIVAVNHLTEFLLSRLEDRNGKCND